MTENTREGFIVPIPTKPQMLSSPMLNGSTNSPISNPFLGGLPNEVTLGVSVPGSNSHTLLSGNGGVMSNGSLNHGAASVWKTVI